MVERITDTQPSVYQHYAPVPLMIEPYFSNDFWLLVEKNLMMKTFCATVRCHQRAEGEQWSLFQ